MSLSHAALINSMTELNPFDSSDVLFSFSLLYWLSAWIILLGGTFRGATRIITKKSFSPETIFRLIETYKITYLKNTPYQVSLMLKSDLIAKTDLSSIKYHVLSGAKLRIKEKIELNSYLANGRVVNTYGLTENAGSLAYHFSDKPLKDTVGQIIRGVCIKIVDESGNRCDVNVDGMICVKPNSEFLGYYGELEATKVMFDDEGFIISGDIGHFDDDGDLIFVARRTDIILYRGKRVLPSNIEGILMKCPDIELASVVGIPDEIGYSELPTALIVRKKNAKISERDVFEMVAGKNTTFLLTNSFLFITI